MTDETPLLDYLRGKGWDLPPGRRYASLHAIAYALVGILVFWDKICHWYLRLEQVVLLYMVLSFRYWIPSWMLRAIYNHCQRRLERLKT